jgi:hypothetical protein
VALPGVTDSTVYHGLRDVLDRQPEVVTVAYRPDRISKLYLRATVDPDRVPVSTGPEPPVIEVERRFVGADQYYRIHYHDPNTGFNCGWHRDEDHPDLGPVHFQYEDPSTGERDYRVAAFEKSVPTEVLWGALERLFDVCLPGLVGD